MSLRPLSDREVTALTPMLAESLLLLMLQHWRCARALAERKRALGTS